MLEIAAGRGVPLRVDDQRRCWFNDDVWCDAGDPHILALDDALGFDWVAVPTRDAKDLRGRLDLLSNWGVRFVEYQDITQGMMLVVRREQCPPDWCVI